MDARSNQRADAWRKRILNQQASGKMIRAWCQGNNCHEHAFYWWRARLGLSPRSGARRQRRVEPRIKFAEVIVNDKPVLPAVSEPLTLRLKGDRELLLPATMPIEQIAKLIRAIEASGAPA